MQTLVNNKRCPYLFSGLRPVFSDAYPRKKRSADQSAEKSGSVSDSACDKPNAKSSKGSRELVDLSDQKEDKDSSVQKTPKKKSRNYLGSKKQKQLPYYDNESDHWVDNFESSNAPNLEAQASLEAKKATGATKAETSSSTTVTQCNTSITQQRSTQNSLMTQTSPVEPGMSMAEKTRNDITDAFRTRSLASKEQIYLNEYTHLQQHQVEDHAFSIADKRIKNSLLIAAQEEQLAQYHRSRLLDDASLRIQEKRLLADADNAFAISNAQARDRVRTLDQRYETPRDRHYRDERHRITGSRSSGYSTDFNASSERSSHYDYSYQREFTAFEIESKQVDHDISIARKKKELESIKIGSSTSTTAAKVPVTPGIITNNLEDRNRINRRSRSRSPLKERHDDRTSNRRRSRSRSPERHRESYYNNRRRSRSRSTGRQRHDYSSSRQESYSSSRRRSRSRSPARQRYVTASSQRNDQSYSNSFSRNDADDYRRTVYYHQNEQRSSASSYVYTGKGARKT